MLKYSSKETHPQKISWTCRPLLCSDAPARLLSLPVSVFHGPQSVMPTLSLISSHIFSLSFYFVLSASRHKHWPWPSRHTVAVLSNCVPFLSLSTHLSLAWMKSLSFWDSVKPQMENYFILPAGLCHWLTDSCFEEGRREGRGRAEGEGIGREDDCPQLAWGRKAVKTPHGFINIWVHECSPAFDRPFKHCSPQTLTVCFTLPNGTGVRGEDGLLWTPLWFPPCAAARNICFYEKTDIVLSSIS